MGGGQICPPGWKSAVFGRKNGNFQKWMDGKSPPQAPQPHLYPTISLYLLEPLLNRLWNVQVAGFRLSSSNVRVSTKKPSKSPGLIGLFRPDMGLNPIYPGGGHMAPRPENRPFPVEKMKFFKNGWTEKALPKPHNPTYTLRFYCIYSNPF